MWSGPPFFFVYLTATVVVHYVATYAGVGKLRARGQSIAGRSLEVWGCIGAGNHGPLLHRQGQPPEKGCLTLQGQDRKGSWNG